MNKIRQFFTWFSKQKFVLKVTIGCSGLILLCCLCTATISIVSPSTPTPEPQDTSIVKIESTPIISPTEKPARQETNTPADTQLPSDTPAPTETSTPTPPAATQTAIAIMGSKTSIAATRFASQTAVAANATSTRQALNAQRTKSAEITATYQEKISQYERVNIQDIVSYPGTYEGKNVIIRAEVYDIGADGSDIVLWLFSYAASDFMQAYMVEALTPQSGVKEGNTYNIYGTVKSCFAFYTLEGYCLEDAFIPKK
jgi:hypothetical protein